MEIMKFENFTYPRGWVNIKVDDDMYIRMARYVTILDKILISQPNSKKRDKYDLQKKVKLLSQINELVNDNNITIKDKISLITILQYLNELRTNFNESSAGFLLEGFLASLIHGKLTAGRDIADITASKSYSELSVAEFKTVPSEEDTGEDIVTYQIKLYKSGNVIKVNTLKPCNYYVICLKNQSDNNIDVHILDYSQIISDDFAVSKRGGDKTNVNRNIVVSGVKSYVELNTNKISNNNNDKKVTLPISDLDGLINICASKIKISIDEIYLKISDLHFDIDSLVTGIDKNNKEISSEDAEKSAILTIGDITKHLTNLSKGI